MTISALLLDIPVPHARYLRSHFVDYANSDVFGDFLLNNPTHASQSRTHSHDCIARLIAEMATQHGVPSTTKHVPYCAPNSQSRADIVTTRGGLVSPNPSRHFGPSTLLVMDFELGHTYRLDHSLKPDTLDRMKTTKRGRYCPAYHDIGLAFAPLVCNSFGQLGPDFLRFLWALADHAARNCVHLPLDDLPQLDPAAADRALADFKRLRGHLYIQSTYKILAAIFEGVTERVYGRTFALRNLARDPPSFHLDSLRRSTSSRGADDSLNTLSSHHPQGSAGLPATSTPTSSSLQPSSAVALISNQSPGNMAPSSSQARSTYAASLGSPSCGLPFSSPP